jgi:cytochrome o ubiquinol oxidase operon protein cyoD
MPHTWLLYAIGAFALVQIVVHLHYFLHVGLWQKREILILLLFSTMLLVMMVVGTLWIMGSLAVRMALPVQP